jgi:chemotaxis protein histidine kinase CheA
MVPIRGTFQKMTRLVRDLAVQQGKDIRLVLQGEDTELDRTLVEELNDPLIHMIRNSADHGIEPAEERIARGKPAFGTITLRAFHQGGFIVIEIQDDGRGLNPDRIRQKAIERGLIRADDDLDKDSILELIFAPGFSTAEQITDLSGRGVGMDVVRRNIEKMRGQIEIHSDVGAGTTFTIYMPLTLAIIEGLLVGVGDQRYVIPTLSVRESFRPLPSMVTTVQGRGEIGFVHQGAPARVDQQGARLHAGDPLGLAADQAPRREEAGDHGVQLPARQGQRGHRRLPGRVRFHLPGAGGDEGQGLHGGRHASHAQGPDGGGAQGPGSPRGVA